MLKKFILDDMTTLVLAACGGEGGSASSSAPARFASAFGSLIERINNKDTTTVGTKGAYAPSTYHDRDSKLIGYDVEVTCVIADKLDVKVEFREAQQNSMMAGLKTGRSDVVVNQIGLISPEHQTVFDESKPYSWSGTASVTHSGSNVESIDNVKGAKTVRSPTNSRDERTKAASAELVPVDGLAQSLALIEQERADATLNDELAILDYLRKNPNAGVKIVWSTPADERVGSGLIVNKGNDEVMAEFSTAINELKADGMLRRLGE